MAYCISVAWCAVLCTFLAKHLFGFAHYSGFPTFASLRSRRICVHIFSSSFSFWMKWLFRSVRTCSSCASRWASCARRHSTWSCCDGIAAQRATVCANCSCRSRPCVAWWATICRHPSCCWIRLLTQFGMLPWKPRMKGDMSKVLTFETMLRGIEDVLEYWISLSSCRGRFSASWVSASGTWQLITCVAHGGECTGLSDARNSLSDSVCCLLDR